MKQRHRGFTLIELLVVIAIIGILASVVLASISTAREKARVVTAKSELRSALIAMEMYFDDTGAYPNGTSSYCRVNPGSNNEVDVSTTLVSNGGGVSGWNGPYMTAAIDPWGTAYFLDEDYQCLAATEGCNGIADADSDSGSSVLVSCGPNTDTDSGACAYDADNIVYYLCDT